MKNGRQLDTRFLICRGAVLLFFDAIGVTILGKDGVEEDGACPGSRRYLSLLIFTSKKLFFNCDFANHFDVLQARSWCLFGGHLGATMVVRTAGRMLKRERN